MNFSVDVFFAFYQNNFLEPLILTIKAYFFLNFSGFLSFKHISCPSKNLNEYKGNAMIQYMLIF